MTSASLLSENHQRHLPITTPIRNSPEPIQSVLDSARRKAYLRLLPLLGSCYIIAYVDRANVALAKLTMSKTLPTFNDAVIGLGAGLFFFGYFLLEIPGALLVEKWSARKWLCRIMLSWGLVACLTAWVRTPHQFYLARFLLGLAEAGFFPGVIVYLTHWFSGRDRARALACFIVATPIAQIISPKISNALLKIGTDEMVHGISVHHPQVLGLQGWQVLYVFWGVPAMLMGLVLLFALSDRPRNARWLTPEEREALEGNLAQERARQTGNRRMRWFEALRHPKVLLLAAAYFCGTTANYGYEFFLPSILQQWYALKMDTLTWLVLLPPLLALACQLFAGWNSDRTQERRWHTLLPLLLGATGFAVAPATRGHLPLTIACFMLAFAGIKSYQPSFWSLPSLFLTDAAAAGSIGLINSLGNLGGFAGPSILGKVETMTGSFVGGMCFLSGSLAVTAAIIFALGLGGRKTAE